ncbi:YhiJ/YhiL family protein, partial [Escherichia coli]|uniref:YhiJ/YhiL family protein n=1 Tax=Escherichia coli TaxID=562 RepID=UPI001BDB77AE
LSGDSGGQSNGHYGLGVDQHQKIDNYTMGLNSWKIAPNERGDKKGVPGLSCFQPH